MFRYAALHRELKTVVHGIRARGERVIVDYARENVNSLNDVAFVRRTNEIMIDNLPIGSMCALKMTSFGTSTCRRARRQPHRPREIEGHSHVH